MLTITGDPIGWGHAMDAVRAGRTIFMNYNYNIRDYNDSFMQHSGKHVMQELAMLFAIHGPNHASSALKWTITTAQPRPMRREKPV